MGAVLLVVMAICALLTGWQIDDYVSDHSRGDLMIAALAQMLGTGCAVEYWRQGMK